MNACFPVIETRRYILRQITENDLENIYRGLSNPDVIKYYGISFDSMEATKEQLLWYRNLEKNETGLWWAICSKNNKRFLGAAGLNNLEKPNKKAEIGFWMIPDFWGKGIMKEVLPFVYKYAFDKLHLHRIEAFVESENVNCKRLLNKLNFNFEGTMIDCERKGEKFISLDIYALIKSQAP